MEVDKLDQEVSDAVLVNSVLEGDELFLNIGHGPGCPFVRETPGLRQVCTGAPPVRARTSDFWRQSPAKPVKLVLDGLILGPEGRVMCGIVGFLDKTGRREQSTGQVVFDMLEALACRGPDGAGVALIGPEPGSSAEEVWSIRIAGDDDRLEERLAGLGRLAGMPDGSAWTREGSTLRFRFAPEPGVTPGDFEQRSALAEAGLEVLSLAPARPRQAGRLAVSARCGLRRFDLAGAPGDRAHPAIDREPDRPQPFAAVLRPWNPRPGHGSQWPRHQLSPASPPVRTARCDLLYR